MLAYKVYQSHTLSSVQFSSVTQSCPTLCNPMNRSTPGLPVHHQLLEFTHVHRVGDAIQPSPPLLFPSPPALNLSQHQGLFKWVSIRWPKYWSFSFIISPSSEYSGLISFRIDWFDLLAVQGTLKSLLQHYSSKASSALKKALSLLYGPTLTSEQDNWKYHSFAYMGLYTRSIIYQMWKNIYLRKHVQHSYIYNIMKQI